MTKAIAMELVVAHVSAAHNQIAGVSVAGSPETHRAAPRARLKVGQCGGDVTATVALLRCHRARPKCGVTRGERFMATCPSVEPTSVCRHHRSPHTDAQRSPYYCAAPPAKRLNGPVRFSHLHTVGVAA